MGFEWDENKKKANLKNHGVSLEEVIQIFDDPFHISILDKRFDYFDERWITIGITKRKKVIVAGYLYYLTEEGEEITRMITARKATKKEREQYENIK